MRFDVIVRCFTYNHAPYITQAMDGFVMQKTTFPYVCTIVDDASKDGEPEIISNYLEKNFDLDDKLLYRQEETKDYFLRYCRHKINKNCYFAIYLLKYNHGSIKKGKVSYLTEWEMQAKYHALCEGDDYWTNPHKLQIQIDFLNQHPNYAMTCNRTKLYSVMQHRIIGENYCYHRSRDVNPQDVINRTGLFISTCSIVYRDRLYTDIPDYWRKCEVSDYPLQIACALKGKIYYFNNSMSVYRVENVSSWMGKQRAIPFATRFERIKSQVEMFIGFAHDFPEYKTTLLSKAAEHINRNYPNMHESAEIKKQYINYFSRYINHYNWRWKIDLLIRKQEIPFIRGIYSKLFLKKYNQKRTKYK